MTNSSVHPSAIIEEGAKLGANVSVGPFSYIGADVEIGDDCKIESHVVIKGPTKIGKGNRFFQFASIGEECQDKKYAGEPTELTIGDNNVFRECVTVHRGTIQDNSLTAIGSNNLFMAYVHIAHDCIVGNNVIMANNASMAGHAVLEDWAIIGGMTGVHQFCKVGAHSFTGAGSIIVQDVPPYVMASGKNAKPFGLNSEGLKRRGFSAEAVKQVKRAYRTVYRKGLTIEEAQEALKDSVDSFPEVADFMNFIAKSERGIIR